MRTVYAQKNKKIILGRQGEDKAVRVVWPGIVSDWSSLYGDGSFQLSVRRFGDENAYPVVVEVNVDDIRFTVTSAETAIAGNGKCELTYIANGTIAKSATWETVVLNSLTGQTPSEPPEEPAKSWFTAIQGQIGNLAELATTSKDNLVAAINEAAQSGGGGGASVELDNTLTESGKAADAKAVGDALAGKQNTISDLEAIRTGASKGATALQSVPSTYRTASAQDTIDSGKVDKVTGKGLSTNDYTDAAKAKVDALAPVATSGSYNDLTDKPTIPTALPNPNALTFTGAMSGSYDGSAPLTVKIPSGGGVDMGINGATVGQIAKITAVDDSGKPTAWEPVDFPSGGYGGGERLVADGMKIATGTIPNGAAAWSGGSFGVTIGDLKKWKKFRIMVNLGTGAMFSFQVNKSYICNNTSTKGTKMFYDFEWLDTERTILGGNYTNGNSYNNPNKDTLVSANENGGFTSTASTLPLTFRIIDNTYNEQELKWVINEAQTAEGVWSIFGILRYGEE